MVALSGCLAAFGGWRFAKASAPVNGPIVLISIDALRPDHLGAYGYAGARTPSIDGLAEDGVVFCTLVVDPAGSVVDVQISTRGVLDETAHADELAEARGAVRRAVAAAEITRVEEEARWAIRRTFHKTRGKKPITIVHLIRSGPSS